MLFEFIPSMLHIFKIVFIVIAAAASITSILVVAAICVKEVHHRNYKRTRELALLEKELDAKAAMTKADGDAPDEFFEKIQEMIEAEKLNEDEQIDGVRDSGGHWIPNLSGSYRMIED